MEYFLSEKLHLQFTKPTICEWLNLLVLYLLFQIKIKLILILSNLPCNSTYHSIFISSYQEKYIVSQTSRSISQIALRWYKVRLFSSCILPKSNLVEFIYDIMQGHIDRYNGLVHTWNAYVHPKKWYQTSVKIIFYMLLNSYSTHLQHVLLVLF